MVFSTIHKLFTVLLLMLALNANATLIDFEGAIGSAHNIGDSLDVGDYRFTLSDDITSGFISFTKKNFIIAPNTTKLIVANHSELTMSRIDGAAFNLHSLDIAGTFALSPGRWADHVDLIAGDDVFTANLAGAPANYQNISPGFNDITSVIFSPFGNINGFDVNYEFVIDNVSVTEASVPEPSTAWLLCFGLALFSLAKWKVR